MKWNNPYEFLPELVHQFRESDDYYDIETRTSGVEEYDIYRSNPVLIYIKPSSLKCFPDNDGENRFFVAIYEFWPSDPASDEPERAVFSCGDPHHDIHLSIEDVELWAHIPDEDSHEWKNPLDCIPEAVGESYGERYSNPVLVLHQCFKEERMNNDGYCIAKYCITFYEGEAYEDFSIIGSGAYGIDKTQKWLPLPTKLNSKE